jgi:hypothetical protein
MVDSTAPTATLSAGTATSSGTATVQSSEIGTAYLVKTGGSSLVTVTNLASITGAADAKWNSVAITTARTNTSLSLAGLENGTYSLYTVDAAGNLSAAATGSFTLDTIIPMVLDLDGNGVRTTAVQRGVLFDVLASGTPVRSGWTDGIDGLLVMDLNGDGQMLTASPSLPSSSRWPTWASHRCKAGLSKSRRGWTWLLILKPTR